MEERAVRSSRLGRRPRPQAEISELRWSIRRVREKVERLRQLVIDAELRDHERTTAVRRD